MKVPVVAVGVALTPSELVAVPSDVTLIGEEVERLTPEGVVPTQTGVMVTVELKPFVEVRVIGMDTSWPWGTATSGIEVSVKSGIAEVEVEVVVMVVVCGGVTTVRVVEAESPIGLPVAVTVYES